MLLFIFLLFHQIFAQQQQCAIFVGEDLGSGNIGSTKTNDVASCCDACWANSKCVAWTFETDGSNTCWFKDNTNGGGANPARTSGWKGIATAILDTSKIVNVVDDYYRSSTIDTTTNRQFFDLDWTDPQIMYLFKSLGPMHARIGGSGGDQNELLFDGTNCTRDTGCIDENLFNQIYNLVVVNGKSRMVWGLPYTDTKYPNGTWDPTQSIGLISYAASQNYTIYGFELGNEDQNALDDHTAEYAGDFGRLQAILLQYFPTNTPYLFGPDPSLDAEWGLQQFLVDTKQQGVNMHGITSHEYYGMNNEAMIDGSRLDSNWNTAYNWTGTMDAYYGTDRTIQMWAGEIGPSIGGSGDCTDNYHRFNIFADGFWYLDSLGSHAAAGYQVFCRQDFYGIDYGLLDCVSHDPAPDYYLALVWNVVNSKYVINTTRPSSSLRSYAHCSKQYDGGVVVMLINIMNSTMDVSVTLTSGSLGNTREDYVMSVPGDPWAPYPGGIYGKQVTLNGNLLALGSDGTLPPIKPVQYTGSTPTTITMAPVTYAFFVFPNAQLSLCKGKTA